MRKSVVLSVVIISILAGCTVKSEQSAANAADFKLQDLGGQKVKLSDFRGKPVLLDFWATWCPPCRASIPSIEHLYQTYGGKGLVVLGISLDDGGWDSVKSFANEFGITYDILKATDDVLVQYQVRTIPTLVLLNKEGKVMKRYIGFGNEEELEKDVKLLL